MEDIIIIESFFKRDEDAIKKTSLKYDKLVRRVSYNLLGNNEDVAEVTNDTYLTLWNTIPPTKPSNFKAYLIKITRNLSLKKLEYKLASKRNVDLETSFDEISDFIPSEKLSNNEEDLTNLLNSFLKGLKKETRVIFVKRYFFNESISAISEEFNISCNAVKGKLHRTKLKLKKELIKEGLMHE